MKKTFFATLIFAAISFLTIVLAYRDLTRIFFLNDEWIFLGKFLSSGIFGFIKETPLQKVLSGESRIIALFIDCFLYKNFPFNGFPFAVLFICMHWINGILVYVLSLRLTKQYWIAFTVGLLFVLTSAASQTLSWIAAGNQILFATCFSLLSFLCVTVRVRNHQWVWIGQAIFFSYCSFLTKPNIVFLSIPFLYVCVTNKRDRVYLNWRYWIFSAFFLFVAAFGFSSYFGGVSVGDLFHSSWVQRGLFNSFYYPLISIAHYFIPFRYLFRMAEWFTHTEYSFMVHDGNIESIEHAIVSDLISLFLSLLFVSLTYLIYIKSNVKEKKLLVWAGVLYVVSLVPIAFYYPERGITFIGSRHLYLGSLPIAIFVVYIVTRMFQIRSGRWKRVYIFLMIIAFIVYVDKQIGIIQREVYATVLVSQDIKSAFFEIKNMDNIPPNPVFLVTSDRNYYYPNNPLPFQIGGGYMIALSRFQKDQIPKKILKYAYLSKLNDQGYIQGSEKGFGFYWDEIRLRDDYCKGVFREEQVIGIHFKDAKIFENTTPSIMKKLNETCNR